jgi:hypothetical protein
MSPEGGYYVTDPNKLAPPENEETLQRRRSHKTDRRSRSNSRTRYDPFPSFPCGALAFPKASHTRCELIKACRTWTCDLPNCTSTANFTRLADLQRHQSTVHGIGKPDFPCTVPRCTRVGDKGFTRRDHLVEHLRNFHHLDIPKRRPGERSANPLGIPPFQ